jgi:hypothetical protein
MNSDISTFLKQAILLLRFFVEVFDKDIKARQKISSNLSECLLSILIRAAESIDVFLDKLLP